MKEVVIVSAVRTAIGNFKGSLSGLNAPQLGVFAVKAALERSPCLKEDVDKIILGNVACSIDFPTIFSDRKFPLCEIVRSGHSSGLKAINAGVKLIMNGQAEVIVAGGVESMSNDFKNLNESYLEKLFFLNKAETRYKLELHEKSYKRSSQAWVSGIFDDEIVPIKVMRNRKINDVLEDELCNYEKMNSIEKNTNIFSCDGSSALVLMTAEKARLLNCRPLAKVIGNAVNACDIENNQSASVIHKLLTENKLNVKDISFWEIDELSVANAKHILKINADSLNIHGGSLSLGNPIGMTGARILTHLIHILRTSQIGCAAISNSEEEASAILIKKCEITIPNKRVPLITLYTKNPCELCDDVLHDLEENFQGQYELKKIYIDNEKNSKFLKLFQYEIPVLFLNGLFLCKNKLNKNLLKKKLLEINMNI